MRACRFCTGWVDDFRKEYPMPAATEYKGHPICFQCSSHLLEVMQKVGCKEEEIK